jgi:hypothetical protein
MVVTIVSRVSRISAALVSLASRGSSARTVGMRGRILTWIGGWSQS